MRSFRNMKQNYLWVGFFSGLLGGLLMAIIPPILTAIQLSSFSFVGLVGGALTGEMNMTAWSLGLSGHLVFSACVGMLYAAIFRFSGRSGWQMGLALGITHWFFVGMIMGIIGTNVGEQTAPGFFGLGYGGAGFLEILALHLGYGALLGEIYFRAETSQLIPRNETELGAISPWADALGQGQKSFESYKKSA